MPSRPARRAGFADRHPNVPTTGGGVPKIRRPRSRSPPRKTRSARVPDPCRGRPPRPAARAPDRPPLWRQPRAPGARCGGREPSRAQPERSRDFRSGLSLRALRSSRCPRRWPVRWSCRSAYKARCGSVRVPSAARVAGERAPAAAARARLRAAARRDAAFRGVAGRGLAPRAGIRPPGNARSGSMPCRSARRAGFANQHPNVPTTGGGVPENDARAAAARRARLAPLAFRILWRAASTARRASPRPATAAAMPPGAGPSPRARRPVRQPRRAQRGSAGGRDAAAAAMGRLDALPTGHHRAVGVARGRGPGAGPTNVQLRTRTRTREPEPENPRTREPPNLRTV